MALWSEPMAIPAEVFLETLGFFTPSSKRIRGIYTKEKVVAERRTADGTTHLIKTRVSANHELGLPITTDLDYYGLPTAPSKKWTCDLPVCFR
jgi:hypothetical protein